MFQKIKLESLKISPQKSNSLSESTIFYKNYLIFSKNILSKKYSKFEYSYNLFCTNNLVFNEKCRIVARFKDYLVLDDLTEFLRRFYSKKELPSRLRKIFNFYESYCKIFPNYMILPESQFLYRNIRKKQKMIDAFNEIKKEDEENRKQLKLGLPGEKKKNNNVVFTKKIQESIEKCYPSLSNLLSNTFTNEISYNINNEFESNTNNKSLISLNGQRMNNLNEIIPNNIKDVNIFDKYFTPNSGSFSENKFNDNDNTSQNSIFKIVQILENNIDIEDKINFLNNEKKENIILPNKKEIKINIKENNNKDNTKKNNNNNNKNNTKKNTNNGNQIANNLNKINDIKKHTRVKTNLNNSKTKKKNQEMNVAQKKKFISHKQNISVPLASTMLNNNINHINNINNIIEGENNTIKIINNINNIIINDDKNKAINNGMIININNNYFQFKETKQIKNNVIKRVKSKEDQPKEQPKDTKSKYKNKEIDFHKFKIFQEKRTYTTYNTQNNVKNHKKLLINEIQSPNSKKYKYQNSDIKKKNINNKKYILTINNSKQGNNNIFRNINNQNDKKNSHKLIESKTALATNPNDKYKNNMTKNDLNNNHNNHIITITEANSTISTTYNANKINNKLNHVNKKVKNIQKLEDIDSIDKKRLIINRKTVNNYLTATHKKRTYQGKFKIHGKTESNNFNNKHFIENNKNTEKIEFLDICNTLENQNNPIKFKLNKNSLMKKKAKTNSLQINNKEEFLASFNLPKDKMQENNIGFDILNIDEKMAKYQKKSYKRLLNNKTQTNSEAELVRDIKNNNENILNTIQNKSIKKEKIIKKAKQGNDLSHANNKTNKEKPESNKEIKKLNVKEMKEKYHKLLRGNKFNHGSYDIANRLHLFKRYKGFNTIMGNITGNINTTIINNKRSPLMKKSVLSPSDRLQTSVNNYVKTPMKKKYETNKEINTIEINNIGNKFNIIGKKNKQMDSNNKKMKFLKK